MVNNTPRIHGVEGIVAEREPLHISHANKGGQSLAFKPLPHDPRTALRQIDTCRSSAGPDEPHEVGPGSNPHLEDALAGALLPSREPPDERLAGIAFSFDPPEVGD